MADLALSRPLDFERERVQHLQPTHPLPSPLIKPADLTSSSIAPVDSLDAPIVPQFKPRLEHPALPAMRVHSKCETTTQRRAEFFEWQMTTDLSTIDRLNDEKEAAIKDFIEKEKSRKTWGMLTTIFQYLCSASSALVGIACIATGNVVPGVLLLIGSAGGFFNEMATKLEWYQKFAAWLSKSVETQEKITKFLEMTTFSLTLMAGFTGGFWAYGAGALTAIPELGQKITQGLQIGTSLMSGGARMKEGHLQKKIADTQAKMKDLEIEIDSRYQDIDESSLYGRKMMESLTQIQNQLKSIIYSCGKAASQ